MNAHLRLALPHLQQLNEEVRMAFALLDKEGRITQSGELPLTQLKAVAQGRQVYAIVHSHDVVVAKLTVPPVPAARLREAVLASVEPMVLSDLAQVCIAYERRAADGSVAVAWAHRSQLEAAWSLLSGAGLAVTALVPQLWAVPGDERQRQEPLTLPADARWQFILPTGRMVWDEWRRSGGWERWRAALVWSAVCAVVWLSGLNLYAWQLDRQARDLRQLMSQSLMQALPQTPVVLEPLSQARKYRDLMRRAQGQGEENDFLSLALMASQILKVAPGQVQALEYKPGELSLVLAQGQALSSDEIALQQAAAARQLLVEKEAGQTAVWRVRPLAYDGSKEGRP